MSNSMHAGTHTQMQTHTHDDDDAHMRACTHLVDHGASKDSAGLVGVGMVLGCCHAVVCLVAVLTHLRRLQCVTYLTYN